MLIFCSAMCTEGPEGNRDVKYALPSASTNLLTVPTIVSAHHPSNRNTCLSHRSSQRMEELRTGQSVALLFRCVGVCAVEEVQSSTKLGSCKVWVDHVLLWLMPRPLADNFMQDRSQRILVMFYDRVIKSSSCPPVPVILMADACATHAATSL